MIEPWTSEIRQQAIQARMGQIVGAENYDRFKGAVFCEVADRIPYGSRAD